MDVRQIETGEDKTKTTHHLVKALQYMTKDVMHGREHLVCSEAREHFDRLDCADQDRMCDHCEGGCERMRVTASSEMGCQEQHHVEKSKGKEWCGWCKLRRMNLKANRRWYMETMTQVEQACYLLEHAVKADGW